MGRCAIPRIMGLKDDLTKNIKVNDIFLLWNASIDSSSARCDKQQAIPVPYHNQLLKSLFQPGDS